MKGLWRILDVVGMEMAWDTDVPSCCGIVVEVRLKTPGLRDNGLQHDELPPKLFVEIDCLNGSRSSALPLSRLFAIQTDVSSAFRSARCRLVVIKGW
jgi:hypothetical protein